MSHAIYWLIVFGGAVGIMQLIEMIPDCGCYGEGEE